MDKFLCAPQTRSRSARPRERQNGGEARAWECAGEAMGEAGASQRRWGDKDEGGFRVWLRIKVGVEVSW